jgi:hypothetical protein
MFGFSETRPWHLPSVVPCLFSAAVIVQACDARVDTRIALVVGNGNYLKLAN